MNNCQHSTLTYLLQIMQDHHQYHNLIHGYPLRMPGPAIEITTIMELSLSTKLFNFPTSYEN
jgi:hypothetical protein